MTSARLVRTGLGFLWLASAAIVLGISALGANNDRKAHTYRPVIALNIAIASLTIIYELIWLPGRFKLDGQLTSLGTEAAITTILCALWVAAATAYTIKTATTLDLCGSLSQLPKAVVKANDLVRTCRVYKVNLAFSWVAVGIAAVTLFYTVFTALSRRGNVTGFGSHWASPFGDTSGRAAPASTAPAAPTEVKSTGFEVEPIQPTAA